MPTERTFSDVNFNLDIHPATKDVLKVYDLDSVKASVKHLVLTEFYGRPFHPEIGSSIAGLLFENFSPLVGEAITQTIKDVVHGNDPRAEVTAVRVEFDDQNNRVFCEIDLYLFALMQPATVNLVLRRVR